MKIKTLAIIMMIFCCSVCVDATSLWQTGNNLFADRKANQIGDFITVLITEQNTAKQSADTATSQDLGIELSPGVFLSDLIFSLNPDYRDSASAQGTTSRSGTIIAEITVEVIEITAAGNFVVEGFKSLTVNGERETITLRGVISPYDLERNSVIESHKIADVEISYTGQGVISAKQRPSFIEWLLNWIF